MMRAVFPYHPTRDQYMKQQEQEQLRMLRSPSFLAMLQTCNTRKVGNHYVIEPKDPKPMAIAAAVASYMTVMQQQRSRKPLAICRAEARESAKEVLELYDTCTPENLALVIKAARDSE